MWHLFFHLRPRTVITSQNLVVWWCTVSGTRRLILCLYLCSCVVTDKLRFAQRSLTVVFQYEEKHCFINYGRVKLWIEPVEPHVYSTWSNCRMKVCLTSDLHCLFLLLLYACFDSSWGFLCLLSANLISRKVALHRWGLALRMTGNGYLTGFYPIWRLVGDDFFTYAYINGQKSLYIGFAGMSTGGYYPYPR